MPHWPTDPAPDVHRVADMDAGEVCNVTAISMAAHTGTHIDAPLHFIATGDSVDHMPLDVAVGEARVITIDDPEVVTREELERHEPHRGERLLLKTANSDRCWRRNCFLKKFVHLNVDAARYLAKRGIRLVG